MPLLLHAAQKSQKRCTAAVVKPMPQSTQELAAQALASLWRRLLQSYVHFSQPGCVPFVVAGTGATAEAPAAAQWAAGFPAASPPTTCDALIVHLFLCNEQFDTLSWVLAFCLIDRLQLHHYVRQRLSGMAFYRTREAMPPAFCLALEDAAQTLFTAYTLAFKWHLDYTVSIKYLTNLLPHSSATRKAILRATARTELAVLPVLGYNCAVTETHMAQLMEHFLTPAERSYVLRAVENG